MLSAQEYWILFAISTPAGIFFTMCMLTTYSVWKQKPLKTVTLLSASLGCFLGGLITTLYKVMSLP